MGKRRKIDGAKISSKERVIGERISHDQKKPAWMFDMIDRDGKFAFDITRTDFDLKFILDKILSYSTMTWAEINSQKHDQGKSKNHYLDYERLSSEAKERIKKRRLEEENDIIYSFALTNVIRLIGIKKDEKFHVLWYDPKHEVYPSTK